MIPGLMPSFNRQQRRAVYEMLRDRLSGLGDLYLALDRRDYATAERLAQEFGDDFRLLDDLGWRPRDDRQRFPLTMPEEDLLRVAKRLHQEAKAGFSGSEEARQQVDLDYRIKKRYQTASMACLLLLRDPSNPIIEED